MKYEKRSKKDGTGIYYSFVHYNGETGQRLRLTKKEIKERFGHDITTEEEAKECLKLLEAQFESEKFRIKRKLAWKEKYYNFVELMSQYEVAQKKNAPQSYRNNVFYLEHYVLPYFLNIKKLNSVDSWPDYFDQFKDWLENDAKLIRNSDKGISYASKNHSIKSLNTFLAHLFLKKIISVETKCPPFPEHLMNERNLDDIVTEDEFETVQQKLQELGYNKERLFHRLLYFTGMRYEEGRGLSLSDLFQGELENSILGKALENNKVKYFGYIVIDSQYVSTLPDGKIKRKPLKGQKKVSEKAARTIPIIDKELWNDLVEAAAHLHVDFKNRKYGNDKKDYTFFRDMSAATSDRHLKESFEACKIRYKSWHCCRHSRATYLIGELKEPMIVRLWLGHKSIKVLEKYNHLYQAVVRQARLKESFDGDFKLKKV
jgi:site-specific recombinase XerD